MMKDGMKKWKRLFKIKKTKERQKKHTTEKMFKEKRKKEMLFKIFNCSRFRLDLVCVVVGCYGYCCMLSSVDPFAWNGFVVERKKEPQNWKYAWQTFTPSKIYIYI